TFTTFESTDLASTVRVLGQNGVLEPFSRDKLFLSLYRSCGHRPNAVNDATALSLTVVSALSRQLSNATISRSDIISAAIRTLENFDSAAAVQYGAYHKVN